MPIKSKFGLILFELNPLKFLDDLIHLQMVKQKLFLIVGKILSFYRSKDMEKLVEDLDPCFQDENQVIFMKESPFLMR